MSRSYITFSLVACMAVAGQLYLYIVSIYLIYFRVCIVCLAIWFPPFSPSLPVHRFTNRSRLSISPVSSPIRLLTEMCVKASIRVTAAMEETPPE
jgi:hypothetical protein